MNVDLPKKATRFTADASKYFVVQWILIAWEDLASFFELDDSVATRG